MAFESSSIARLFILAVFAPAFCLARPTLSSGRLGSGTIDVTKPAASPTVTLDIAGTADEVGIQFQSPSGHLTEQAFFAGASEGTGSGPGFTGKVVLHGYIAASGGAGGVLSPYAEPGVYKLTSLLLCGSPLPCVQYIGSSLPALFPKLTFRVVNPGTPDVTPPAASSASIKTRVVSIANGPTPLIDVHASDNLSGIYSIFVAAHSPDLASVIRFQNQVPARPMINGVFKLTGFLSQGQAIGTYTVTAVILTDIAGNSNYVTDQSALAALFDNKLTIKVRN
jgi:hypothetical protein